MSTIMDPSDYRAPESVLDPDEVCQIYVRLLTMGWLDPSLVTPRLMEHYAVKLGHYTRLARREREARMAKAETQRHTNVHPLMREMVNDIATFYGVPRPWVPETQTDEQEDS
jgi:hypothetical protein